MPRYMDKQLLEILACPICKGKLQYSRQKQELICRFDKIAFPIQDNVPVMIEEQTRNIGDE